MIEGNIKKQSTQTSGKSQLLISRSPLFLFMIHEFNNIHISHVLVNLMGTCDSVTNQPRLAHMK